jgi:hypothetical protein
MGTVWAPLPHAPSEAHLSTTLQHRDLPRPPPLGDAAAVCVAQPPHPSRQREPRSKEGHAARVCVCVFGVVCTLPSRCGSSRRWPACAAALGGAPGARGGLRQPAELAASLAARSLALLLPSHSLPCCSPPHTHPQVESVDDALDLLTASEPISGYRPAEGAPPTEASKAVRLQRLPPLLALFLMRFDPANLRQKIRWGWGWCVCGGGGVEWVGGNGVWRVALRSVA